MGLPCMNCGADTAADDSRFFAECFVCPKCHELATRTYDASKMQLEQLLLMLKEMIRHAIIEKKLRPEERFLEDKLKETPWDKSKTSSAKQRAPTAPGPASSTSNPGVSLLLDNSSPRTLSALTTDSADDANATP